MQQSNDRDLVSQNCEILEEILYFVESTDGDEAPDGLFVALIEDFENTGSDEENELIKKIQKAVKKNPAFKDKNVINYVRSLPLFYLLGIDDFEVFKINQQYTPIISIEGIEEYYKIPIKIREEMLRERLRQGKSASPFVSDEEHARYQELKRKLAIKNQADNAEEEDKEVK